MISSNIYVSAHAQSYLSTANCMYSIRNFKTHLRIAPASICLAGVHWQVALASSLQNVKFYIRYNSGTPRDT